MKQVIMAAIVALFMGQANAQHLNIGIKGGLNLYNIHDDTGPSNDAIVGFHLGILGHVHMSKQFAFQPEVMLSTQGASYKVEDLKTSVNLIYVNVPLLVQYMFDNGFRLEIGPQIGILASANSKFRDTKTDITDDLEPVDFGLAAGFGYVSPRSGLGADIRYNFGLTNINKSDIVTSTNRGIQIGLFYLFDHK